MRKRTALLLMVLLFVSVFPTGAGAKPVKLSMWTHHRHMADHLQYLVAEFNRTTGREKGIVISLRIIGDDAWDIFQNAQSRGEGPDLYSSGFVTGYADPFAAGVISFFDELPGFAEWKAQWPDWYWIEGLTTYQGRVYAVPTQVFNSRLIYNKDLFRQAGLDPEHPPRSYREVREYARKITDAGKGVAYGFAYCGADCWPLEWMPSQWAEANGDPAYWDWKNGRWAMQGYLKVFQLILEMKEDGSLFPGAATLTNDALRAQFAQGRIGMFMGESWDVGVLTDQFPAKCDWGVAPIPTYDGEFHGKPRAMLLGGFWNINRQSRHKLEAWEVVKWFARYEIRGKMLTAAKNIDLDPKVLPYVEKSPQNSGFAAFAGTLDQDYLATYPHLPGWQAPEISPCTVFQRILAEGGDLEEELRKVDEIWNRQLDEYFATRPWVDRGWNTYPEFDGRTGWFGLPQTPHTYQGVLKPGLIDEWMAVAKDLFPAAR